jgi:hypothetical protein
MMAWNPLAKLNVRWMLTILVSIVAATGLGFLIGLWLGS